MLRFLYIEDNPTDAYLFEEMINSGSQPPCTLTHAQTLREGIAELKSQGYDGVLLDLALEDSKGLQTLTEVVGAAHRLPIIVLTSTEDDQLGVQAIEHGAQDYLVKDDVTLGTFARAIRYAVERKRLSDELNARCDELERALAEVKRIKGLIRICSVCKRVVNEKGDWQAIEAYVRSHSDADFTHGYCPECGDAAARDLDNP